jgi:hypothetical protein
MKSKTMMNQEFVKQDCFDGMNFVRWKDKMMFFVYYFKDLLYPWSESAWNFCIYTYKQ